MKDNILRHRRPSTRVQYISKWFSYSTWASESTSVLPIQAPVSRQPSLVRPTRRHLGVLRINEIGRGSLEKCKLAENSIYHDIGQITHLSRPTMAFPEGGWLRPEAWHAWNSRISCSLIVIKRPLSQVSLPTSWWYISFCSWSAFSSSLTLDSRKLRWRLSCCSRSRIMAWKRPAAPRTNVSLVTGSVTRQIRPSCIQDRHWLLPGLISHRVFLNYMMEVVRRLVGRIRGKEGGLTRHRSQACRDRFFPDAICLSRILADQSGSGSLRPRRCLIFLTGLSSVASSPVALLVDAL